MPAPTRRTVLLGGVAAAAGAALAACSPEGPATTATEPLGPAPRLSPAPGQRVVARSLVARPTTLDLGGVQVDTWAYADTVPGPLLRARAGDLLRITLDNQLPDETTVHWHGVRVRNVADGVPGMTQDPIRPGERYLYEFTAPDPGTYFFHPHVGVQLDRGLYAPLVVDDPDEPGRYDEEWVVVLDDWIDGTGTTPDEVLEDLTSGRGSHGGMGMDHGSMMGHGGDVTHPYHLVNGRLPGDPDVLRARPGQRIRIRVVNAGSDTIYTLALGGHRMTVTHSDGWPVQPQETAAILIGMGERYDLEVTLGDGVFPLAAVPFGKPGSARALVRTGGGTAPAPESLPDELRGTALAGSVLSPAESARLDAREPDDEQPLDLSGGMGRYRWAINGRPFGENTPLSLTEGRRTRLQVRNRTMMAHPVHLHGHTFALPNGLRKDTVLVPPMGAVPIDLDADNPGDWMAHCHNIYHAAAGMMIAMNYRT